MPVYGIEAAEDDPVSAHTAGRADGVGGASTAVPALTTGTANGVGGALGGMSHQPQGQADGVGQALAVGTAIIHTAGTANGVGSASALYAAAAPLQFLNRTTGLDHKHQFAYITLINSLVSSGVWAKLDVLYIFSTTNQTIALTNLVSSYYTGVAHGSPTFGQDTGFAGVDGSQSVYIDTGFLPPGTATTQPTPSVFQPTSNHISAWPTNNVTSSASGGCVIGQAEIDWADPRNGGQSLFAIYPQYPTPSAYVSAYGWPSIAAWIFEDDIGAGAGAGYISGANSYVSNTSVGHWLSNRTGANASQAYLNSSLVTSPNTTWSGIVNNWSFYVLASHTVFNNGYVNPATSPYVSRGSACNLFMVSIGAGLTATDATNFYNALLAYYDAIFATQLPPVTAVRLSDEYLEVLTSGSPVNQNVRLTQLYLAVWSTGDISRNFVRLTQQYLEVVST
jgi:hypothetical protein